MSGLIEWSPVPGYEGIYEVNRDGRVRSLDRYISYCGNKRMFVKGKGLVPIKNRYGYLRVNLCNTNGRKAKYIHQIVASAFVPNSHDFVAVNHKDEDKENNRADNLEWCDAKYNGNYGTRRQRISKRKKNQRGRPVIAISEANGNQIIFPSLSEAERNGYNRSAVWAAINNSRQTHGGVKRTYRGYNWGYLEDGNSPKTN